MTNTTSTERDRRSTASTSDRAPITGPHIKTTAQVDLDIDNDFDLCIDKQKIAATTMTATVRGHKQSSSYLLGSDCCRQTAMPHFQKEVPSSSLLEAPPPCRVRGHLRSPPVIQDDPELCIEMRAAQATLNLQSHRGDIGGASPAT